MHLRILVSINIMTGHNYSCVQMHLSNTLIFDGKYLILMSHIIFSSILVSVNILTGHILAFRRLTNIFVGFQYLILMSHIIFSSLLISIDILTGPLNEAPYKCICRFSILNTHILFSSLIIYFQVLVVLPNRGMCAYSIGTVLRLCIEYNMLYDL